MQVNLHYWQGAERTASGGVEASMRQFDIDTCLYRYERVSFYL
jgi:hypothetical protein